MKKISLLFFITLSLASFSQNTGYAGRKFIIKNNLLNGTSLGVKSFGAEYAFHKHYSLNIGFVIQDGSYNQVMVDRDINYIIKNNNEIFQIDLERSTQSFEQVNLPKVSATTRLIKISLKRYFGRVLKKAPRGLFFEFGYSRGLMSISNGSVVDSFSFDNSGRVNGFSFSHNYDINDININSLNLFFGYQEILLKRLTIETSLGINQTYYNINSNENPFSKEVLSLSSPYIGPNIYSFKGDKSPRPFTGVDRESAKPFLSSLGFTVFIKAGFLLF